MTAYFKIAFLRTGRFAVKFVLFEFILLCFLLYCGIYFYDKTRSLEAESKYVVNNTIYTNTGYETYDEEEFPRPWLYFYVIGNFMDELDGLSLIILLLLLILIATFIYFVKTYIWLRRLIPVPIQPNMEVGYSVDSEGKLDYLTLRLHPIMNLGDLGWHPVFDVFNDNNVFRFISTITAADQQQNIQRSDMRTAIPRAADIWYTGPKSDFIGVYGQYLRIRPRFSAVEMYGTLFITADQLLLMSDQLGLFIQMHYLSAYPMFRCLEAMRSLFLALVRDGEFIYNKLSFHNMVGIILKNNRGFNPLFAGMMAADTMASYSLSTNVNFTFDQDATPNIDMSRWSYLA